MADRMTFMVENARLFWRNFAGKPGMYNAEGVRNFCVELEPQVAEEMAKDGWNVKFPEPDEENEDGGRMPYIQVRARFDILPPKIIMITSSGRTILSEDTVEVLDYTDIRQADLICNASNWNVNGKSGIKAYLKSLYVTVEEDALDLKYAEKGGE